MEQIPVVVVCGPTACGKTALGVQIAKEFGGEVVSADSMQIYRRLDIGTAKPSPEETEGIPHHMIDIAEPWEAYSVARYCAEAGEAVRDIHSRGLLPVIVGGTGLYIDNLIANTDFSSPEGNPELREELAEIARLKGNEALHAMLRELDSAEAERIHPNNVKRVIRAIELVRLSGEARAELNEKSRRPSPFKPVYFSVEHPREELYSRINKRVDLMLERGLVEEVRRELLPVRAQATTAAQAIGYKEILAFFDGNCSLGEAADAVKQNSRRYAKRQITWFRRNPLINRLSPDSAADEAYKILKNI